MSNGIPFYLTNLLVLRNQIHCWTITKDVVYIYKKKKKILYFPNNSFMVQLSYSDSWLPLSYLPY